MSTSKYRVGDTVIYDNMIFVIEVDYGNGVYFIGNDNAFVDLVNESELEAPNV